MNTKQEKWVVKRRGGAMEDMVAKLGITPGFARILCGRGFDTVEKASAYLYPDSAELTPAAALPDAERFCAFLFQARELGQRVRIIGDYDADGVTSTYIMLSALKRFGIEADYRIPNRVTDGYGISADMVREAKADNVQVIITVDNGIAAVSQIALAKELQITVLITDHHEPQEVLPKADAIVDFKCHSDYPGSAVCGCVVAGKLMDMLLSKDGKPGFFLENVEIFALATVSDVMELSGENRTIVRMGLSKPVSEWNMGLRKLVEANHLKTEPKAYSLGFVLAPCINAFGRLASADPGVSLLLETDEREAFKLAASMVDANSLRKDLTVRSIKAATTALDPHRSEGDYPIVYLAEECHESIAGIVAGKLRERYYLPSIVLCRSTEDPGLLKGSGRSVEGYSIFDGLQACGELFERFGGHAQACGLSIREEKLSEFRSRLTEHYQKAGIEAVEKITIDLVVNFSDVTKELISEIGRMEPFGAGNQRPVFAARNVTLVKLSHFGRTVRYTRMSFKDESNQYVNAVYFGDADEIITEMKLVWGEETVTAAYAGRGKSLMHILFTPQISSYNSEVEIILDHYQLLQ